MTEMKKTFKIVFNVIVFVFHCLSTMIYFNVLIDLTYFRKSLNYSVIDLKILFFFSSFVHEHC